MSFSSIVKKAKNVVHKVDPIAKKTDELLDKGSKKAMSVVGDAIHADNSNSAIARLARLGQKYTDPLYHILPKKYYADPLTKIADKSNELASKVVKPLAQAGRKIDPVSGYLYKNVAPYRKAHDWTESKPADTAAAIIGGMYGYGALSQLGSGGAGGVGEVAPIVEGATGTGVTSAGGLSALAPTAEILPEVVITGTTGGGLSSGAIGALSAGAGQVAGNTLTNAATQSPQQTPQKPGVLEKTWNYAKNPENWDNIAKVGGALGSLAGSIKGGGGGPTGADFGQYSELPPVNYGRGLSFDDPESYYSYGSRGERQFYQPTAGTGYNAGRLVRGPGTGRSDDIPARLSDGEYVMDAETVALLGDGSTDEGARRLDQMRQRLRKEKGKELSRGKFSSAARHPDEYLEE